MLAWSLVLLASCFDAPAADPAPARVPSPRLRELEPPRLPAPTLLRMRGTPVRPLSLREQLDPPRLDRVGLHVAPNPTNVAWPAANPQAIPRVNTGVGLGHSVVLGTVEMYARGGATIGVDATPRNQEDDRHLRVVPQGRFGMHVRPTQGMRIGFEVARLGPVSFDPMGDELRGLATLRWRFSLVPRR